MVKINREVVVGVTISLLLHVASLVALSFIVFQGPLDQLQTVLDSVFDEERVQEEFTQDVEQSDRKSTRLNSSH